MALYVMFRYNYNSIVTQNDSLSGVWRILKRSIRNSMEQQKVQITQNFTLLASTRYANMMAVSKDIPIIRAPFLIIDCAEWTISHVRCFFIHCHLFFSHISYANGESCISSNIDLIFAWCNTPDTFEIIYEYIFSFPYINLHRVFNGNHECTIRRMSSCYFP